MPLAMGIAIPDTTFHKIKINLIAENADLIVSSEYDRQHLLVTQFLFSHKLLLSGIVAITITWSPKMGVSILF